MVTKISKTMFVTVLTAIYLALAVFVFLRYLHKKRQKLAQWVDSKGLRNTYFYKLIEVKKKPIKENAEISQAYAK